MAPTLGKRKRKAPTRRHQEQESSVESSNSVGEDAQAIFKRHFEAHFKPLPATKKLVKVVAEVQEEIDEETDWDGISETDDNGLIEIVEHTAYKAQIAAMSKAELRIFMSPKPPTATPTAIQSTSSITRSAGVRAEDDLSEAAHAKHDLALQRLLAESHLLDSSSSPTLSGTNRHKATDMRLQALGSKKSIMTQEKMPASHRRGIITKKEEREEKRRIEARENGIILERVKGNSKRHNNGKREHGIGGPGVGKFASGTLTLSKKDILDIEGPRKSLDGKGRRGGGTASRQGGKRW